MRIEFLFWDECPSHPEALARLRSVLRGEGVDTPVEIIEVRTEAEAAARAFPGSPTIRINGADIQPPGDNPIGLSCRVYHSDGGRVTPLPTEAMIRRAVRTARGDRSTTPAADAAARAHRTESPHRSDDIRSS
jgi:hypothetical protein